MQSKKAVKYVFKVGIGQLPFTGKGNTILLRKGRRTFKLQKNPYLLSRKYSQCIVPPALGWFPYKHKNFIFSSVEIDSIALMDCFPVWWNASLWVMDKNGLFVLRVPKSHTDRTVQRLRKRGFRYNPVTNRWDIRKRRKYKKSHTASV